MLVRTAQTAIEPYAADHDGTYAGATTDKVQAIEGVRGGARDSELTVNSLDPAERDEISVQSASGNSFSVIRGTDGRTSCSCSVEGASGCPSGGNLAGCPAELLARWGISGLGLDHEGQAVDRDDPGQRPRFEHGIRAGVPDLAANAGPAARVAALEHLGVLTDQPLGPAGDAVAAQETDPEVHLPHLDQRRAGKHHHPPRVGQHEEAGDRER